MDISSPSLIYTIFRSHLRAYIDLFCHFFAFPPQLASTLGLQIQSEWTHHAILSGWVSGARCPAEVWIERQLGAMNAAFGGRLRSNLRQEKSTTMLPLIVLVLTQRMDPCPTPRPPAPLVRSHSSFTKWSTITYILRLGCGYGSLFDTQGQR